MKHKRASTLPKMIEIEEQTTATWLAQGTIAVTSTGEENTYYTDEFNNNFYCKNYPQ